MIPIGIVFLYISLFVTGCLSPPKVREVVPTEVTITKRHQGSVGVQVNGGIDKYMSGDVFFKALVTTISNCGVFSSIAEGDGDYRLDVTLVKETVGPGGFYSEVGVVDAWWKLTRMRDSRVMEYEEIITPFVSKYRKIGEMNAVVASAGKLNIAEGLRRLSLLDL